MITCPSLLQFNQSIYFLILTIIACTSPFLNGYAVFCILFRSKNHMTFYKWLLLKHQLLGFTLDIVMSICIRPILVLPFPGGYSTGIFPSSISAHYYAMLVFFLATMTQASVIHLFDYRYLLATGKQYFPNTHKIAFFCIYVSFTYPALSFILALEDQQTVLNRLQKQYSCFTKDIASIPGLVIYDPDRIAKVLCLPLIPMIAFTAISCNALIFFTRKCLKNTSVSPKTIRLQQRFLIHLCIQVMIPLLFILLPGIAVIYIVGGKVFNMTRLFLQISLSCYGALGAIVLVALNPSHYTYDICRRMTEVKPILRTTSTKYDNK